MLLGFISLLLTVCEKPIANICIPRSVGESFIPCPRMKSDGEEESKCEEQVTDRVNKNGKKITFLHSVFIMTIESKCSSIVDGFG